MQIIQGHFNQYRAQIHTFGDYFNGLKFQINKP